MASSSLVSGSSRTPILKRSLHRILKSLGNLASRNRSGQCPLRPCQEDRQSQFVIVLRAIAFYVVH